MLNKLKSEEILTYLLLIIIGYFIAKMFSRMCSCGNGFSVGGQTCDMDGLNEIIKTNCKDHIGVGTRWYFNMRTCENPCKDNYNTWYDYCNEHETDEFNELKGEIHNMRFTGGFDIDRFHNICNQTGH